MIAKKITCDVQEGDEEFVNLLEHQINMLCGLVKEILLDNPAMLLSPVLRETVADKARQVKLMMHKVRDSLHVDNPGEPLHLLVGGRYP